MIEISALCKKYGLEEKVLHELLKLQNINDQEQRLRRIEALLDEL
jgi:hypothetical protein